MGLDCSLQCEIKRTGATQDWVSCVAFKGFGNIEM